MHPPLPCRDAPTTQSVVRATQVLRCELLGKHSDPRRHDHRVKVHDLRANATVYEGQDLIFLKYGPSVPVDLFFIVCWVVRKHTISLLEKNYDTAFVGRACLRSFRFRWCDDATPRVYSTVCYLEVDRARVLRVLFVLCGTFRPRELKQNTSVSTFCYFQDQGGREIRVFLFRPSGLVVVGRYCIYRVFSPKNVARSVGHQLVFFLASVRATAILLSRMLRSKEGGKHTAAKTIPVVRIEVARKAAAL